MASIRPIQAPGTVRPAGHYSQAVVHGGLVYVSGQLPTDLATGAPAIGTIEEQTELCLRNIGRILESAGSGLEYALQMSIFIARIDDWAAINAVYARTMGNARPTRAVVPVGPLHHGAGLEIVCIAALPPAEGTAR